MIQLSVQVERIDDLVVAKITTGDKHGNLFISASSTAVLVRSDLKLSLTGDSLPFLVQAFQGISDALHDLTIDSASIEVEADLVLPSKE